jgi:hypothetical protein
VLLIRYATFANIKYQEGPDEANQVNPPSFPDDKKKQYASRKDIKEKAKKESQGVDSCDSCKHNWMPQFTPNMVRAYYILCFCQLQNK